MAFHKKEFYPQKAQLLAQQAKGLNQPARTKILLDLIQEPLSSLQLSENQAINRTTILQHLNTLRNLNYISVIKHKPTPIYSINTEAIPLFVFVGLLEHPEANKELIIQNINKKKVFNIVNDITKLYSNNQNFSEA